MLPLAPNEQLILATLIVALCGACKDDSATAPRPAVPVVTTVDVQVNPLNALSLVVRFEASHADSARAVYRKKDGTVGATPYVSARAATSDMLGRIVALGLEPSTEYFVSVEVRAASTTVQSDTLRASTGALPDALRSLRFADSDEPMGAPSGYLLVVPFVPQWGDRLAYIVVFDRTGRLVWYREFINQGWAVEAKQQANGHITVFLGRSYGWQPDAGRYVEVAPDGEIVGTFASRAVPYTDPHDLLLTFDDMGWTVAHLLGYSLRGVDLSSLGGPNDTTLAVHVIERQEAGATRLVWDAGDHYSALDWPSSPPRPSDLVHPSSLDIDNDGNYYVSLQGINEIVKIDGHTGRTLWRFGGRRNEFTILDDRLHGFRGQHSVRVLKHGDLLLFDNRRGESPGAARVVQYALDTQRMTARMVWTYAPSPSIASPIMGSVQRLASGNTVVGFSVAGRIIEVDARARVLWDAELTREPDGTPTQFYRALRIASLYGYARP